MVINKKIQGTSITFAVEGRLNTNTAVELENEVKNSIDNITDVTFDLEKLEYISSAGLRIFLTILQNTQEKGGHVYIKGISDDVRAVFALTGFINIFEFI